MNSQEAKFILQAYRSNGGDASDAHFREALEQAQHDPELGKWFAEENAINAAVSRKLKAMPVPADLKSNILAGRKMVEPVRWWQSRTWLAAAACFLVLAGISTLLLSRPANNFGAFRTDMAQFLSTKLDRLDMDSSDMSQIRDYLKQHGGFENANVPEKVAALRKLGCRILDWRGEKVTLICFKLQGPEEVHLLVADRAKFRNPPPVRQPQFEKSGDWMTASWSRDDKVYILAGLGDRSDLAKFF